MRGSIRKRSKDSWEITVDLGRGPDGRRLRKFVAVQGRKADADRRLRELLASVDKGLPLDNSKLTVAEYLETWLRDVVSPRNRARTAEGYTTIVRRHVVPVLGSVALQKLQAIDVDRLMAQAKAKGLSDNTAHHIFVVLSKALRDALKRGMIYRNPCQAVDPPRPGRYEVNLPGLSGGLLTVTRPQRP